MIEIEWTNEEIAKLKRLYPYATNNNLSRIFDRSVSSIQHKATRLKIHKNKKFLYHSRSISRSGDGGSNWKGGKKFNRSGYVLVLAKGHPMAERNGYMMEHRLVMSTHLGRTLSKDEDVHHINGNKTDNRIENLEVINHSEHTIMHHTGMKRSKETCKNISISKKGKARIA